MSTQYHELANELVEAINNNRMGIGDAMKILASFASCQNFCNHINPSRSGKNDWIQKVELTGPKIYDYIQRSYFIRVQCSNCKKDLTIEDVIEIEKSLGYNYRNDYFGPAEFVEECILPLSSSKDNFKIIKNIFDSLDLPNRQMLIKALVSETT